jgi:hypothetical protein
MRRVKAKIYVGYSPLLAGLPMLVAHVGFQARRTDKAQTGWLGRRLTLCGYIEIKTDRNGRDEKHCGSATEVHLSP